MLTRSSLLVSLLLTAPTLAQSSWCQLRAKATASGWDALSYNNAQDTGYFNSTAASSASVSPAGGGSGAGGCSASSSVQVQSRHGSASISGSGSGSNCATGTATIYTTGDGAYANDRLDITSSSLPDGTRIPLRLTVLLSGSFTSVQPASPYGGMRARLEVHATYGAIYLDTTEPGVLTQTTDAATVGSFVQLNSWLSGWAGASSPNFQLPGELPFIASCSINAHAKYIIESLDPRVTISSCSGHNYAIGACPADVDDGTGTGTPDAGITIDDLIYYLGLFEAGNPAADLDDGSNTGTPDGGVTIDDLIFFLTHFEAGC